MSHRRKWASQIYLPSSSPDLSRFATVITPPSSVVKYPVSRENSLTHAQVLDKAVEQGIVLPVKFCTIAEAEEDIVEKVLKDRYQEFMDLMKEMEGKVELELRAWWRDLDS